MYKAAKKRYGVDPRVFWLEAEAEKAQACKPDPGSAVTKRRADPAKLAAAAAIDRFVAKAEAEVVEHAARVERLEAAVAPAQQAIGAAQERLAEADDAEDVKAEVIRLILAQQSPQPKKLSVGEARGILLQEEPQRLIAHDRAVAEAIERVEESGIVFLDEIDKVATSQAKAGPDISREGVQRDLLPIIEGSTVTTKYGIVHTHHILFIAAGAVPISKPADLIPALLGRFPIRGVGGTSCVGGMGRS